MNISGPTANNAPLYVGGGVFIVTMIGCIVLLIMRPGDNSYVILLAFAGPVLTTLLANKSTNDKVDLAVAKVEQSYTAVAKVHELVNSQSDMLRKSEKAVNLAQGYEQAKHEQSVSEAAKEEGRAEGVAEEQRDQANRDEGVIKSQETTQ